MATKKLQEAIDYINEVLKDITTMNQLLEEQVDKLESLVPVYKLDCNVGIEDPESLHYLNVLDNVSKEDRQKCIKYLSMVEKGCLPLDMPTEFMGWFTNLNNENKCRFINKIKDLD